MKKLILSIVVSLLLISPSGAWSLPMVPCKIPLELPQWNELVLRLWAGNNIPDGTFLKNFPLSGESGDRILRLQGYDPKDLKPLAECLLKHFKEPKE